MQKNKLILKSNVVLMNYNQFRHILLCAHLSISTFNYDHLKPRSVYNLHQIHYFGATKVFLRINTGL